MVVPREVHLVARPSASLESSCFEIVEVPERVPSRGEILVQNIVMSVDPYMRPRLDDVPSYVPPYRLGEPLDGAAIGEVVVSKDPRVGVGDLVLHDLGWREQALVSAKRATVVDPQGLPASTFLGALGMPGFTAWLGLTEIAPLRDGDLVFVSGAAGAVGTIAGQLAALRGHAVVGSAGRPEKVRLLRDELGFRGAFDYHVDDLPSALESVAPEGVDVYFDNVGGAMLTAALRCANVGARFALCGAIADYDGASAPDATSQLWQAIVKRVSLRGFIATDHLTRFREFQRTVRPLVASGQLHVRETTVEGGIEAAPGALIALLAGENTGKMLVGL